MILPTWFDQKFSSKKVWPAHKNQLPLVEQTPGTQTLRDFGYLALKLNAYLIVPDIEVTLSKKSNSLL